VRRLGCPSPASRAIAVQGRPRSLALEHGDLLAESHNFQGSIGSGPEESARSSQEAEKELKHELTVVTWRNAISIGTLDIAQLIDFVLRRGIVYAQDRIGNWFSILLRYRWRSGGAIYGHYGPKGSI